MTLFPALAVIILVSIVLRRRSSPKRRVHREPGSAPPRHRRRSPQEAAAAAVAAIDADTYRWTRTPGAAARWLGPLQFSATIIPAGDLLIVGVEGPRRVNEGPVTSLALWFYPIEHDRDAVQRAAVAYARTFIAMLGHPVEHRPDCARVIADALAGLDAGHHSWVRDDDEFAAAVGVDQHWTLNGPAEFRAYLEVRGDTVTALVYGPHDLLGHSVGPLHPRGLAEAARGCLTTMRHALCEGCQLCPDCPTSVE